MGSLFIYISINIVLFIIHVQAGYTSAMTTNDRDDSDDSSSSLEYDGSNSFEDQSEGDTSAMAANDREDSDASYDGSDSFEDESQGDDTSAMTANGRDDEDAGYSSSAYDCSESCEDQSEDDTSSYSSSADPDDSDSCEDQSDEPICDENEKLNECPNGCDDDACPINLNDQHENDCVAPAVCLSPECQCIPNYKRDDCNNCIPIEKCPEICAENEEFSNCTQIVCRAQNCAQLGGPVACPSITPGSCKVGCVCKLGTLRNSQGKCVPEDQCKVCPTNEEFTNCTQAVCRNLKCSTKDQPIACASIAEGSCRSGCVCQSGYLRTEDGECVSEDRCQGKLVCDENETVNACPGSCFNDFCPTSQKADVCTATDPTPGSKACGAPVCTCRFNYKRDNLNKTCIPTRDCPPFDCSGEPYQEYNSCPPFCPTDNCSQATPTGRCPLPGRIGIILECRPTCRCIQGYWRNNGICVPYADCPGKGDNSTAAN